MSGGVSLAALAGVLVPARQLEAREKRARLATAIASLDQLLGGGWPRGAVSELSGGRSSGRTAVMLASLASAIRQGEAVSLLDAEGSFDPWAALRAGVPLPNLLWVRLTNDDPQKLQHRERGPAGKLLGAAELVIAAGGFGLVALDFGDRTPSVPSAAWMRLRRLAETQGTALLVVTARRLQGVLGACVLTLAESRPRFSDSEPSPLLLGLDTQAALSARANGAHGQSALRLSREPARP